jgi:hypothetical protein
MEKATLARGNYVFFFAQLTMRGIFSRDFFEAWERAWRTHPLGREGPVTHVSFSCGNGECGYLRFRNMDAAILYGQGVTLPDAVQDIARHIKGDLNERCEIPVKGGLVISLAITSYEGELNGRCVEIHNPLEECPDHLPLGRMVEMRVTRA